MSRAGGQRGSGWFPSLWFGLGESFRWRCSKADSIRGSRNFSGKEGQIAWAQIKAIHLESYRSKPLQIEAKIQRADGQFWGEVFFLSRYCIKRVNQAFFSVSLWPLRLASVVGFYSSSSALIFLLGAAPSSLKSSIFRKILPGPSLSFPMALVNWEWPCSKVFPIFSKSSRKPTNLS